MCVCYRRWGRWLRWNQQGCWYTWVTTCSPFSRPSHVPLSSTVTNVRRSSGGSYMSHTSAPVRFFVGLKPVWTFAYGKIGGLLHPSNYATNKRSYPYAKVICFLASLVGITSPPVHPKQNCPLNGIYSVWVSVPRAVCGWHHKKVCQHQGEWRFVIHAEDLSWGRSVSSEL